MFKHTRAAQILVVILLTAAAFLLVRSGIYGWTIFALLPVAAGALGVWITSPTSGGRAAMVGGATVLASSLLFLLIGLEGMICILMAAPLTVPLGVIGGLLAYRTMSSKAASQGMMALLLLPPATLTWDVTVPPQEFAVQTQLEIDASPEQVWPHVIRFSELPEPEEWFFRAGLAYPKRARIEGTGAGAIRYCEFSTGPFVEPIEVWDEPHLLRFRVTANPAPMEEWSPYRQVIPKHLHGYLVSKRGQFRLTALDTGRTRLEGTTWYQHGLWPAEYWRWWSDAIIHRIHLRVLNHIRTLAETM
ncbi:MAG: SRPBCC family protein [Acidobacteria bacterium]|nr:SRPBCC family protein [Acidobacteriota bacterium]